VNTHCHAGAQGVDPRIAGDRVLVVGGGEAAEDERHRHHVLQAVIAVGGVRQRTGLVDDAHRRFLGVDDDAIDVVEALRDLSVQLHGTFHRGLGVKLGREADLEENVLHHVTAQRPCQPQFTALEQHLLETPPRRGQRRGIAHLARQGQQRETDTACGGIPCGPALARSGVGRVTIGAQGAPVDPGVGERTEHLLRRTTQHDGDHSRRCHAHQQHVIEPDAIEAVLERQHTLDLVCQNHGREQIAHGVRHGRGAPGNRPPRESRRDCPTDAPTRPPARCR
jgi:hypothetical protein